MDQILKIVHIITRLILGGAQENTILTCRELAARGHDVTLITGPATGPEGSLFGHTENMGFEVVRLERLIRAIRPINDYLAYCELKMLLRKLDPDIIHTHSAKAGIVGRFAGHSLKKYNKDGKRPAVVHGVHGLAFHRYQSGWLNRFYIAVEKAAAEKTDAFICVADAMTEQSLAVGIGRKEQYTTAYSAMQEGAFLKPIDEAKKQIFRQQYKIDDDAVVLVTVARLFELKGHDYIIESAKRLACRYENVVWLFVGNGNLAGKFKREVKRLGLEGRIKFTGLLQPDEIPLAIGSSDILVHCSLREGLARALPQAMLCGKPAIAFDLDGAREVVNENTGRLVEAENVDELTSACEELIKDADLRRGLGEFARESVKGKFAPDTMVDVIEKVYERLLVKDDMTITRRLSK